ncbi:molybdate ABC transporter permease subunit [Porifericola rhodea]|uniref:molybdate ABC transporter permease subunit n=1 Tax=Porifericola rhodea TaxID=930972 RepID=UPI0026667CF0|nr:molybdate ABC transporter permease subunit [Porifericola rhodea]WKN30060.1 molybdate ABC transporter permease subunit [Porifericola rhodea]
MSELLQPFVLSLELAGITTVLLFLLAIPLVYLIYFAQSAIKPLLKAVVSMPLVLPPTVLGYYLLIILRPEGWLGKLSDQLFDLRLVFSFPGLVIGSLIFSLPFMVNPILSAIENLPASYKEAAYTLGKSRWNTLWHVFLPNVRSSVIVGLVMTFAHTIGEFGVILMIGGNIPEETRVASIAIYNEVEMLNFDNANIYATILLLFSFVVLFCVYFYQNRRVEGVI